MNNLSKIGLRLKLARELCELTQQQIADKTATPQANYARYESGVTKKVPHSFLHKVAKILCVDFEWLLVGKVNKSQCDAMNAIYLLWHERTDGLSEKVGVPQRFLEAIVNSQVSPSGELTKKIEEATGLRLDVPEKEIVAVQNEGSDYFKKEIEQLKQERDWLRKQNEDLLQIIKSFKKE